VLIPRPETERLVEIALEQIPNRELRVLDLGTGSGAIAVTAALERPEWRVTASDVSSGALRVAQKNAKQNGAALGFVRASILERPLAPKQFDWIISNPPYLEFKRDFVAPDVLRFEPKLALEPEQKHRIKEMNERGAWIAERILRTCAESEKRPEGCLFELSPRVAYALERKWKNHPRVLGLIRFADLAGRRRFLLLRWKQGE
jgi:HemK-like putative methylase